VDVGGRDRQVIVARNLTKRFGRRSAVDDLSFDVAAGVVTGFLGPNGSGKSTTMRLLLELDHADGGTATFDGRRYHELVRPLTQVGSLLDATYVHPSRSAAHHLRWVATANGLPRRRVDEVLAMVGLSDVAGQGVGRFSLGMRQRLGIAASLLGDPPTLLLDEPANGLDPEGILWVRRLLKYLADQGRTVFVSSHLLAEMSLMADALVVIGRGRLIAASSVQEFITRFAGAFVSVRSPTSGALAQLLRSRGATVETAPDGALRVTGLDPAAIGELAAAHGIVLHELAPRSASLEEAFLEVTREAQEYAGGVPGG
jgi:ABC-2 type transport system ATP-binding protein